MSKIERAGQLNLIIKESPTGSFYAETNPDRALRIIPFIDIVELKNPNILIVGLGITNTQLLCTYEPFQLAAHLEATSRPDYKMTLLDINEDIVNDIIARKKLYFQTKWHSDYIDGWEQYLKETGQSQTIVKQSQKDLVFNWPYIYEIQRMINENEIVSAEIPRLFLKKLSTKDVVVQTKDITKTSVQTDNFDFIVCLNTLLHVSDRFSAMKNLLNSARIGGYLLVDQDGTHGQIEQFIEDNKNQIEIIKILDKGVRLTFLRKIN